MLTFAFCSLDFQFSLCYNGSIDRFVRSSLDLRDLIMKDGLYLERNVNRVKTCKDYPDAYRCCESCHEDMAMGITDVPMEVEDDNFNVIARVCCAKFNWLEENANRSSRRE